MKFKEAVANLLRPAEPRQTIPEIREDALREVRDLESRVYRIYKHRGKTTLRDNEPTPG